MAAHLAFDEIDLLQLLEELRLDRRQLDVRERADAGLAAEEPVREGDRAILAREVDRGPLRHRAEVLDPEPLREDVEVEVGRREHHRLELQHLLRIASLGPQRDVEFAQRRGRHVGASAVGDDVQPLDAGHLGEQPDHFAEMEDREFARLAVVEVAERSAGSRRPGVGEEHPLPRDRVPQDRGAGDRVVEAVVEAVHVDVEVLARRLVDLRLHERDEVRPDPHQLQFGGGVAAQLPVDHFERVGGDPDAADLVDLGQLELPVGLLALTAALDDLLPRRLGAERDRRGAVGERDGSAEAVLRTAFAVAVLRPVGHVEDLHLGLLEVGRQFAKPRRARPIPRHVRRGRHAFKARTARGEDDAEDREVAEGVHRGTLAGRRAGGSVGAKFRGQGLGLAWPSPRQASPRKLGSGNDGRPSRRRRGFRVFRERRPPRACLATRARCRSIPIAPRPPPRSSRW